MNVKMLELSESIWASETKADFDRGIDNSTKVGLLSNGFAGSAHRTLGCLGWIWRQWLLGTERITIANRVDPFVREMIELRNLGPSYFDLPYFDIYLLTSSIFCCSDDLIRKVARLVGDSSGDKGHSPMNDGELYAAAWCGMMKYWILGDTRKVLEESELIWKATRKPGFFAAPKNLTIPWINKDWDRFKKEQKKDFEKLWKQARKDRYTVRSENDKEIVVTTRKYQIDHQWCWAHCGMAMLVHRAGIEIVTDPLWFPRVAIINSGDQNMIVE